MSYSIRRGAEGQVMVGHGPARVHLRKQWREGARRGYRVVALQSRAVSAIVGPQLPCTPQVQAAAGRVKRR